MSSSSPSDFLFSPEKIPPISGPANDWTDLEKALFRLVLAAPKQEWVFEAFFRNFVLFHDRQKRREQVLFVSYTEAESASIRELFYKALAAGSSKMKLIFVLFGGGDEAHELLQPPPGPSHWAAATIIHVADNHQFQVVNGKPSELLSGCLKGCEQELLPTLADIQQFKLLCLCGLQRWKETRKSLQEFQERLGQHFPWVTYVLLAFLIIYAVLTMAVGGFENTPAVVRLGALVPDMVRSGEWWRLVTTGFLHGGIFHLLCNGYALYILGSQLERTLGNWRFLLLYVVSLLGGSLASTFMGGDHYSVGASGAIWGLMCADAVLMFWPRGLVPQEFASQAKSGMLSCLLVNIGISFMPGIDMSAHLGGGVAGALLMGSGLLNLGMTKLGQKENPHSGVANMNFAIAGGIAIAFMAAATLMSFKVAKPFELGNPPPLVKTTAFGQDINLPALNDEPFQTSGEVLMGGNLLKDAAAFELLAKEVPELLTEEDGGLLLQHLQEQAKAPAEGMRLQSQSIQTIGDHQALQQVFSSEQVTIRRNFWLDGHKLWRFDLLIRNRYLNSYAGICEAVIRSR